jgi:hypothetical protein
MRPSGGLCLSRGELTAVAAVEGLVIGSIVGAIRGIEKWKPGQLLEGRSADRARPRVDWALVPTGHGGVRSIRLDARLADGRDARQAQATGEVP